MFVINAANSFPVEEAIVADGPGGATTTLNIVFGGVVSGVTASGSSVVNNFGGVIQAPTNLFDTSRFSMSAGEATELNAAGTSSLDLSGGRIQATLNCNGCTVSISNTVFFDLQVFLQNATGEVSGGSMRLLQITHGSQLLMTGGEIRGQLVVADSSFARLQGGNIQERLIGNDNSSIEISGGNIREAATHGTAQISIFGGSFDLLVAAVESSLITIIGDNFNFPLGPIANLSGTLTGTLGVGTPISVDFIRATTAPIILAAVTDTDNDDVVDGVDNCINVANPEQTDSDDNGLGDACNDAEDTDGDEWADNIDNCPDVLNSDQSDIDMDRVGDDCDPFPDNPNNELAQCDQDLTQAVADTAVCELGLGQCQTNLSTIQTDLGQCQTDLTTAQTALARLS